MKRPILFNGEMVRAILDGRKTQTRRVVKDKHKLIKNYTPTGGLVDYYGDGRLGIEFEDTTCVIPCPYGKIGDRLWVRETHAWLPDGMNADKEHGRWVYRADGEFGIKWKPSIFMPRHASRITLEITGVRVERLNDISEEDAIAEGVDYYEGGDLPNGQDSGGGFFDYLTKDHDCLTARESFKSLWQSINGHGSWQANPWVWVIEFRKVD